MKTEATTSEYLLLFRGTDWHQSLSSEEIHNSIARFTSWFEKLNSQGKIKSGLPLKHLGKIVTGKRSVMDGPFAESKEAIAGFFLILAQSLDEAVEMAKECPGLDYGQTVEVRPVIQEAGELECAREKAKLEAAKVSEP